MLDDLKLLTTLEKLEFLRASNKPEYREVLLNTTMDWVNYYVYVCHTDEALKHISPKWARMLLPNLSIPQSDETIYPLKNITIDKIVIGATRPYVFSNNTWMGNDFKKHKTKTGSTTADIIVFVSLSYDDETMWFPTRNNCMIPVFKNKQYFNTLGCMLKTLPEKKLSII